MIEISCTTNIDCAKCLKWPTILPERPMVGDLIRSTSSTDRKYIELQVVAVTWVQTRPYDLFPALWHLVVELHLPKSRFESIGDFEKHVRSL